MHHDAGCDLSKNLAGCVCEGRRLAQLEEEARTLLELNRVKSGDSLTRFDPPLEMGIVFRVAARTLHGSIVGYELHIGGAGRLLVGHVNERGGELEDSGATTWRGHCVAARKAWLGA